MADASGGRGGRLFLSRSRRFGQHGAAWTHAAAARAGDRHGYSLRLFRLVDRQRGALVLALIQPQPAAAIDCRRRRRSHWRHPYQHADSQAAAEVCAPGLAADSRLSVPLQQLPGRAAPHKETESRFRPFIADKAKRAQGINRLRASFGGGARCRRRRATRRPVRRQPGRGWPA